MKKRLLFFTLAICLILPCVMLFTACGGHTHDFSTQYTSNETHHWFECLDNNCNVKSGYVEHNWDAGQQTIAPTCTENGQIKYICQDCAKEKFVAIPASHNFDEPTYKWSEDNSTCTATRECINPNCEHDEHETVDSQSQITQQQSCVSAELTTYTATFENSVFKTQTKENVETKPVDPTKHSFDLATYDWSEDNSTCKATRVCLHNGNHKEEEEVAATPQVIQAQTCENVELTTYTATFLNTSFETQTKQNVQTKNALGHSYDSPSYSWSAENSTCTATRECTHPNCEHDEHETVDSQSQITQQKSCENVELTTYIAEFENENFATQTKENVETNPALGHDFENGTYITTDGIHHWKKCSRCDEENTGNKEAHDYTGDWVTDGTHHWKECEICGKIQEKIAHTFNQEVQSAEYLKVVATCENPGEYYHSCVCGEKGQTTFETAVCPHSYEDGACSHCGATEGLVYASGGGVTGYTGSATNVIIPKYTDNGKLNTSIAFNAFRDNTNIESVKLPSTIKIINMSAFEGCTNLTTINLSSVEQFKSSAFENCSNLCNISIDSATALGQSVFKGCERITSVVFPNSIQLIDMSCFWGCSNLKTIEFGTGVTTINNYAFRECTSLQRVVMPDNITTLRGGVFHSCTALNDVTLSKNLAGEMESVFRDCTSLETITIPAGVTIIGYECFASCSNLKNIIFAEGILLSEIGDSAFSRTKIESISLPNTVTRIGYQAFYRCFGLTIVETGNGVETIGKEAFASCGIKSITIPVSLTAISESMLRDNGNLVTIKYTGTEAEWNALPKGGDWDRITGDYVVMCSDNEEGLAKQTYINVYFYFEQNKEYCSFAVVENQTVSQPTNPEKDGFVFEGWYVSTDGGTTLEATSFDFETPITASIQIYAKWSPVA